MSSNLVLRARNLSKVYAGALHPIAALRTALFGFAGVPADQYPVLNMIDLEIHRGETVGIMGRNGAGKTTLLGILGDVIQQSSGTIERFGKIATLLGLSAGFNPNFSGRENAYLFCSIQGLSKKQTDDQIENIENFAALGKYFEMPLRTYSSGMQSRLAFACAVHVQADLIIIDETLAVGDANFRMKCYDRIREMKASGQTFLLVSHSQNLIANYCTRGIVLDGGRKVFDGPTIEAIEKFKLIRTNALSEDEVKGRIDMKGTQVSGLEKSIVMTNPRLSESATSEGKLTVVIRAELKARRDLRQVAVNFGVQNQIGVVVCSLDGPNSGVLLEPLTKGETAEIQMSFDVNLLGGRYSVSCMFQEIIGDVAKPINMYQNFAFFEVAVQGAQSGIANLHMKTLFSRNPTISNQQTELL
jgi:ABC-type polysaccharide/polyol phosphate transport system ATPase subunit